MCSCKQWTGIAQGYAYQVFGTEIKSGFSLSRYESPTTDSLEESLSHKATKEKLPEQELHKVSEKLSRRLNELDSVSEIYSLLNLSKLVLGRIVERTRIYI